MTDTEILNNLLSAIDTLSRIKFPASPKLLSEWASWVAAERVERRVPDRNKQGVANPTYQHFWRCRHHPEAIANWAHGKGWHCEHGCDTTSLQWYDHGVHQDPGNDNVPHGTIATATVAKATVSHLTGVCEWVLADQPKEGIFPAAFSWWDCAGRRRYGYPSRMICDACGRELRLVSDGCKPAT